jgi:hypothetical protein|tara:strand:- start:37 stop:396 length:360 start_codon:yes stop_codon:yes gene_type:complete
MGREARVSLKLRERNLRGLDFEKLGPDLKLLAQQPSIEVDPFHKKHKLDYEKGSKHIHVREESEESQNIVYDVVDRAKVEGGVVNSQRVGRRIFAQQEIDSLKREDSDFSQLGTFVRIY